MDIFSNPFLPKWVNGVKVIEKYLLGFLLGLHESAFGEKDLIAPEGGIRNRDQTRVCRGGRYEKSLDVLYKNLLPLGKIRIPKFRNFHVKMGILSLKSENILP